ncbi:MAG: hypothetical protein Q9178_002991 [Gyalolechia marmorata]
MATNPQTHIPQPAPGGGVTLPPSQEKIHQKFDLSIALTFSLWPALTLSVQNSWGGPNSDEKRDWFAGAVSDLFASTPNPDVNVDVDYLEEFLLQVMNDVFEVNVEDGSAAEVAGRIVGLWKVCGRGEFAVVDRLEERWRREREGRGGGGVRFLRGAGDDEEEDSDEEEDEDGDEDEDVEMDDAAPELVKAPKEKIVPQVDEEGFTEVVGKKRR